MIRLLIMLMGFSVALSAFSEKVQDVNARYTYNAPETLTLEMAKRVAIERAKIQALADEFGTIVSQNNSTVVSNRNGDSDTQFFSLGGSEVKGEWIADTKDPNVNISYLDNSLVITAEVWGKARKISRPEYGLSIQTLCNGLESEKFKDKDRLSVRLKSPVEGYFSIWLADDETQQVFCMLPYENSNGEARNVKSKSDNVFLSTVDSSYPYIEETIVVTTKEREYNRIIYIFSTERFTMPLTEQGEYLPELSTNKFEKWLQKNRMKDEKMYVEQQIIEITNE